MFDAQGLPKNDEGEPVFKMSYNFRTEPNVCYDVVGKASVRTALHPYGAAQRWSEWKTMSSESTYHLCEDESEVEWVHADTGKHPARNKHEVRIEDGYVSLICMHNPACTGAERHSAGEYSEYGDPKLILGTPSYASHLKKIAPFDAMVDALSLAAARGEPLEPTPHWALYQQGLEAQRRIEEALAGQMRSEGNGREGILAPWMLAGG